MHLNGDEKLHEDYLAGLRRAALPGRKFCGDEDRAGLREWRREQGWAAALSFARRRRDRDQRFARWAQHQCGLRFASPGRMQKRVVETGASLGVAFDGDADRALFSTASGKLVDGDGVLLVAGRT